MSTNSGDFLRDNQDNQGNQGNLASSGRSGPPIRLIVFAVLAVISTVFVLQNRERTSIDFLVFELRSRTWTAIGVSILLGVVLDRLFLGWWRRRRATH